ncbi:hypothetical protein THASP1DRAFT_30331 [Thamnocephalis sphaerospora]|uniref:Uncharacterized protein n=1 Tax=Thamnocephalis sphaerospora TaxID=78915 RepID=A0A4V1IWK3_9FUNG|nr:hypothetical protein THASP1DRAFT_30331 [Thamnocephalis sphaerospora]|eukprot:RKP07859.1 hypothetical protein THASP1DRAFT_30331 [Thamnocephalis sphaerospora]
MLFNYTDRDTLLEADWEKDATYKWGIPLHPLGEINTIDYVMQAQGNLQDMRARTRGIFLQLATSGFVSYLFVYNVITAALTTLRRPRALSNWCCLIQAISGIGYVTMALMLNVPGGTTCRQSVWYSGSAIVLSSVCVSITLLQRAYLAHGRSKRLLFFGIVLLLPQPLTAFIMWTSPTFMVPSIGCYVFYPHYFPWVKLAVDAPINTLFSIAFITVVYQQYRRFGSAAWAQLVRNGIQTMCTIALANLICMICVSFEVLGLYSEMFFAFDWILVSTLLARHCKAMSALTTEPNPEPGNNADESFSLIVTMTGMDHAHTSVATVPRRHLSSYYIALR